MSAALGLFQVSRSTPEPGSGVDGPRVESPSNQQFLGGAKLVPATQEHSLMHGLPDINNY